MQGRHLVYDFANDFIDFISQYNNTELSLLSAWDWSVTWDLPLNSSKCFHLPIGQPPTTPLTFADGTPVALVETAKDLGVAIDTFFRTA